MAVESILGGVGGDTISEDSKALIAAFMGDTIAGTAEVADLGNGGFSVFGTGASGELQGVVASGDVAVAATVQDGTITLNVALPAGVSLGLQGPQGDVTVAAAKEYFQGQINAVLPADSTDPVIVAYRDNLNKALDILMGELGGKANVKIVTITDNTGANTGALGESATATGAGNVITFESASTSATTEVLTFLMSQVQAGNTLELKNVASALLIGDGSVMITGNQGAKIVGDIGNQKIVGSAGADTLVGGGGTDVLVGSGGNDVYGIKDGGNVTIVADKGDSFGFKFDGLTTLEQLLSFVTKVDDSGAGLHVEFAGGALSVTLVGLHAADVTADMIKFTI